MRRADILLCLLLCAMGAGLGFALGKWRYSAAPSEPIAERDTLVIRDTLTIPHPIEKTREIVRYATVRVTDTDTLLLPSDTVWAEREIAIPIERTEYRDSDYRAVVSGCLAALDTIEVYPKQTIITLAPKPKRWHLGASAGLAITPKGAQPYVGVGVTYSIKSF